jgi:NodT family efflux transporter outer membrane factor (OMF) lipoprotein
MPPQRAIVLPLLLALGACTAGPDYKPPQVPSSPALQSNKFLRAGDTQPATPVARWWEGLGDPVLTGLIDKGLHEAPSITAAEARVRQARAQLSTARANMWPSTGGGSTYIRAELPDQSLGNSSGTIELFEVGFDAQWEIDLWGAQHREIEKARAQAEAAAARLADARVSLSAEIARTYVELRARESSLALVDERYQNEARNVDLVRQRVARGTAPIQAGEAALIRLRRTVGEQAAMAAETTALRDGLAVLTGSAPGTLDGQPRGAIPLPPASVSVGDPAAMLARRPDIRAAERELAASNAQIGVEEAKRFPQVSLLGLIGIGGTSASDLFDSSQLVGAVLPRLRWNFLDFGRIHAQVEKAKAGRDLALADYDSAVLSALQDAEASLARFGAARTTFGQSAEAARHAAQIADLQNQRADAGAISRGEALEARCQAIDAKLGEIEKRAGVTLAFVALVKALGLGWELPAPAVPR